MKVIDLFSPEANQASAVRNLAEDLADAAIPMPEPRPAAAGLNEILRKRERLTRELIEICGQYSREGRAA